MSGHTTPIRVLLVDDSPSVCQMLARILEGDSRIRIVGAVQDGRSAVDFVGRDRPDVVVMDLHMPVMDGFEATRRIMETRPVPIVVCTGMGNPHEVAATFRVMEVGALACVPKPVGPAHPDFAEAAETLRRTVRLMSEVKVVRRWGRAPLAPAAVTEREDSGNRLRVVGIGASTGGPQALQQILSDMPKDCPVPILVVQHIARGFLPGLTDWLHETTGQQTHVGAHGIRPKAGHFYFAPDDYHMGLHATGELLLTRTPPVHHLRPSVGAMFQSIAETCGANGIGVLLTGMGRDGSEEMKLLQERGALTIAQDQETSVVHGMPGEAIRLGAARQVLPLDRIAEAIMTGIARGA